jgi:hypothetical protein
MLQRSAGLARLALVLTPAALGQNGQDNPQAVPMLTPLRNAGTYHVATGTWTRTGVESPQLGPDVIYNASRPTGYFLDIGTLNGQTFQTDLINGVVGGGTGQLPTPPGGTLTAGQTWNFQTWVRIPGSSRFSPAITVVFQ